MSISIERNFNKEHQRGFSLIELMIAIPLGMLVMFAVLRIFTANIHGVSVQNALSRVQENGRMSMELITRDIRAADYWGCIHDTSSIENLDSSTSVLVPSNEQGVLGENNVDSSTTIADIEVKENTDTLTLRGSKGFSNVKIKTAMTSVSADIALSFTDSTGIESGDLLLISDSEHADLFINTSSTEGTISHSSDFSDAYGLTAQLLVPYIKTYFIGASSVGTDMYSLYRSEDGGSSADEIVRGINDLQFVYGEDTTGDGYVDTFSNASDVADMDNVLSIRMELTAESGNGVSGTSLQRTYTVTANIRNRSF